MSTKYDMPTNEGSLALARAVATGAKIIVRGAALCNVSSGMGSVSEVAALRWSDISSSAIDGAVLPCTSYLPSMVDYQGTETGKPIAALDLEFTYMPSATVTYNVIAVLADVYYAIIPFQFGNNYKLGDVVSYNDNTWSASYYRCIQDINGSNVPFYDDDHWEKVTLASSLDGRYGGIDYSTISEEPVLLYVSKTSSPITLCPQLELDYKVRLYLDGVKNTEAISEFVVFDTLGPEFMASAQLNFMAMFANQLKNVRDIAMAKVSRS